MSSSLGRRVTEAGSDLTNVFPFTEQCSTTFPSILPKPTKNFTVMSFICKTGVLLAGEYAWMCLPASVCVWERTCVAWVADSITWRTITLACQRPKDLRKISRLNRSSPLSFPSSSSGGGSDLFWQNQKCNLFSVKAVSVFDQWQVLILANTWQKKKKITVMPGNHRN